MGGELGQQGVQRLQRMDLGLARQANRACDGEGQLALRGPGGLVDAGSAAGVQLALELAGGWFGLGVGPGIARLVRDPAFLQEGDLRGGVSGGDGADAARLQDGDLLA